MAWYHCRGGRQRAVSAAGEGVTTCRQAPWQTSASTTHPPTAPHPCSVITHTQHPPTPRARLHVLQLLLPLAMQVQAQVPPRRQVGGQRKHLGRVCGAAAGRRQGAAGVWAPWDQRGRRGAICDSHTHMRCQSHESRKRHSGLHSLSHAHTQPHPRPHLWLPQGTGGWAGPGPRARAPPGTKRGLAGIAARQTAGSRAGGRGWR